MSDNPIDMEHLNEVTDNDREFQKELFVLFSETAEKCILALESLSANDNSQQWRERVHELKGSSANMGANTLAGMCKQAMDADTAPSEQKKALLASIQAEYVAVKHYFQQHIA